MTDDYSQPRYEYNSITGSVVHRHDGWHVVIRKFHTDTGVERYEQSKMRWKTEDAAKAAVIAIVNEMLKRI